MGVRPTLENMIAVSIGEVTGGPNSTDNNANQFPLELEAKKTNIFFSPNFTWVDYLQLLVFTAIIDSLR